MGSCIFLIALLYDEEWPYYICDNFIIILAINNTRIHFYILE